MNNALGKRASLPLVTHPPSVNQPTPRTIGIFPMLTSYVTRALVVALLILAAVAGVWPLAVPPTLPAAVAPDAFSVERALVDLEVITAQPRVPGMPGLAAARDYLANEFAAIGLAPEIGDTITTRQSAEVGVGILAQSHNIVARLPGTESTGAIVIAGHLDSVHTTGGAGDCGGCSVSVLEVARALMAGPALRNDVIFLIEDGEETTRAGALAFVEQHPWAQDVRVAFNQEAMGSGGTSLLYVTGPENGLLIPEALKAMPAAVAYSFVNDLVWFTGTGGSDLDQLLMTAPVGLGLVHVGNESTYHASQDNVANLDPRTLQHRGDQMLALVRHFGNLPLDGPLTAPSVVYFTLVNGLTVQYPAWVGVILALLIVVGYLWLLVSGLRQGSIQVRGVVWGALLLIPLVSVATAVSGMLWYAMRLLDTRLQVFLIGVSYDRAWYTLAFVLLTGALVVAGYAILKRQRWIDLGVGALAWWILLAALTAWRVPGSSPIFALPALLALLPLGWMVLRRDVTREGVYLTLLGVAAAGALLIVAPTLNFLGVFSGRAELLMSLPMIALLPAPLAGLLAALLLPLWESLGQHRRWLVPMSLAGASLAILVGVGLTASFSPARPKPNMVVYVSEAGATEEGQAQWVTVADNLDTRAALLDEWTTQFFPTAPQATTFNPWGAFYMGTAYEYAAYAGLAPLADFLPPTLELLGETRSAEGLRQLQARLHFRQPAPMQVLRFESEVGIAGIQVLGKPLDELARPTQPSRVVWVELYGLDTTTIDLAITLISTGNVRVQVEERFYQLPDLAEMEIAPRPAWMMPSTTFITDSSLVRTSFVLP